MRYRPDNLSPNPIAEDRFNTVPVPAAPFRETLKTEFDALKERLLRDSLESRPDPRFNTPIRRAANEAASLAWLTPFPLLFFPALFEEKAEKAARHESRQSEILWASPRFLKAAA